MSGIILSIKYFLKMGLHISETRNFIVEVPDFPLIDREDGGHLVIDPKLRVKDRQALSPEQAIELMRLTLIVGEAMTVALKSKDINIGRINYQDNGNWSVFNPEGPFLHIHLYGRATNAKTQRFGQSLYFPHKDEQPDFYSGVKPLNTEDAIAIRDEIEKLFALPKYSDQNWKLV
jgi:diadenosine tetraphosphate (Ap4A) HIT family hydrolase